MTSFHLSHNLSIENRGFTKQHCTCVTETKTKRHRIPDSVSLGQISLILPDWPTERHTDRPIDLPTGPMTDFYEKERRWEVKHFMRMARAKDSGNFGRNSNGKIRFGFLWPEYSGSLLEVVHLFRSEYSDLNSPFQFWQTGSLPYFFRKGMRNGKSHRSWSARFDRELSFHFP